VNRHFLLIVLSLFFVAPVFAVDLLDGLYAYYKLDETSGSNFFDVTGISGNGITYNMEAGDWDSCKINNCLVFDGVNEYALTQAVYGYAGTVSFWMDPISNAGSRREIFMGCSDFVGGKEQFLILQNWDNGNTYWGFEVDSSVYRFALSSASYPFPAGFFHVVFRWDDSTGDYELLWNSVSVGSASDLPTIITHSVPEALASQNAGNYEASVKIDEVGFWDRWLSDDEVAMLYNGGDGLSYDNFGEDVASESSGRSAIEEGIRNVLGDYVPIYTNQSVYVFNGTHSVGVFDKVVKFDNQVWAFNYVTDGESYNSMVNLSSNIFVWEKASMTYSEIEDSVTALITNTKTS